MTTEADGRELLPIACTLGPQDGAQRIEDWRRLGESAGIGRQHCAGTMTLRFRDQAGVGTALERLVAAESDCCSFLGWELMPVEDEWHVVVTGTDEELAAISFGLTDPDQRPTT